MYEYRIATLQDLEQIWEYNVQKHPGDDRWKHWREEYIGYNLTGQAVTFVVVYQGTPIGEATLLIDKACSAIGGKAVLADNQYIANVNALRIQKAHEGKGHISKLVHLLEDYARQRGCQKLTIGVDESELRNRSIYLHWGYDRLILQEEEDGEQVLYYEKELR